MIVTAAVQVKAFANGNKFRFLRLVGLSTLTGFFGAAIAAQFVVRDPGVRSGAIDAGQPLASLSQTPGASNFFTDGQNRFQEVEAVQNGLGPRFNSNQCSSCHSQPAVGGTSPSPTVFPSVGPNPETQVSSLYAVIHNFNSLTPKQKKNLLNFLRSL
jgi:hypothetical protein